MRPEGTVRLADLAELTGEDESTIRRYTDLGVLAPTDDFTLADIERVRLGRIVKQIGDAFMLVFGDSRSAVGCALEIRDAALREPQFLGTRQGLHWGPVLYREGDYYGATVNLAARIVAVCGMPADRGAPAARLQFGGRDVMFCSQECLKLFVTNPDR